MTNEDKAFAYANKNFEEYSRDEELLGALRDGFLYGAEWKDKQFKDILKRKLDEYHKKWETSVEPDEHLLWGGKEDAIGLLLMELFGEDGINYSDRDE